MSRVRIGHNSAAGFVEDESLSLSARGYEFQFRLLGQIIERLSGFTTVTLRTARGDPITKETLRRFGADGGLDFVLEIDAKTEAASKRVHRLVMAILLDVG